MGRAWCQMHSETGGSMGLPLWVLPGAIISLRRENNNMIQRRSNLLEGGREAAIFVG